MNQRSNCQHPLDHRKGKIIPGNIYFYFTDYTKAFDCVDHKKIVENSKMDGNTRTLYLTLVKPVHRLRSNRTRHGATDWFKIGTGVCQCGISSSCLFSLYAEYLMRNTRLDEAQAGIKISGRNINNLRYVDDATLIVKSEEE